jgi:hypothetical protein
VGEIKHAHDTIVAGGRPVLVQAGEFSIRGQIHLANQPGGHGDLSSRSLYSHGPLDVVEGHLLDIPRPAKHRRDLLQLLLIFILRELKYPVGLRRPPIERRP